MQSLLVTFEGSAHIYMYMYVDVTPLLSVWQHLLADSSLSLTGSDENVTTYVRALVDYSQALVDSDCSGLRGRLYLHANAGLCWNEC